MCFVFSTPVNLIPSLEDDPFVRISPYRSISLQHTLPIRHVDPSRRQLEVLLLLPELQPVKNDLRHHLETQTNRTPTCTLEEV